MCIPSPVPGPGQDASTGWVVVTSTSWEWSPEYGPYFFIPVPHQQVCFTVEEEALTLYIDHHKTAKTKPQMPRVAA